jgi:anti-sigma-K factor RskA
MSEGPDLSETEALAAEHALGVLSRAERAAAEARMAREPEFAALVEAWRARLAPMLEGVAPVDPPRTAWPRIARALPANDNARSVRMWRMATLGSLGLAAASMAMTVMLATRPPAVAPPAAPMPAVLNASLTSQASGQPMFIAAYDPARKALIVTSLVPPGTDPRHVHQLWLIPADGKPHSLGMVTPGTSKSMPMPDPMTPMLQPGATLAVSVEPPGGSPLKTAPSGPIAAVGKLDRI